MKNILVLILISNCTLIAQTISIAEGSDWKYYDTGDVGTPNWKNNGFDDSSWSIGQAELGYGDGDEATVIGFGGNSANKHITTHFRNTVTLTSPSSINCRVKADDGVVVYLNGTEVFRAGMPTGAVTFSTLASSGNENVWFDFTIPASSTQVGVNTFAVEIHQVSASSSDISFDFEAIVQVPIPSGLFINELMASNDDTADDQSGSSSDWIEIFNNTSNSIDLNGYYVSDDSTELTKHQISGSIIIPNGTRTILWASGTPNVGSNHLDFGLSSGGEWVGITDPNGTTLIDSIGFSAQRMDVSFGRQTDGSSDWRYFSPASFDATNIQTDGYLGFLEPPVLSEQGGFYTQPLSLTITSSDPTEVILYSTDGSSPDAQSIGGRNYTYRNVVDGPFLQGSVSSFTYQGTPISIDNRSMQPNVTSTKAPSYSRIFLPNGLVSKSTVVKAVATKPGYLNSEPATGTFFVYDSLSRYSLPVVSFATSEDHLFEYNYGNYTPGVLGVFGYSFCIEGNFNQNYEYDASFEYFDAGQRVVNQNVRYRIHGGCSTSAPRKSLRIYSPTDFGYDFFSTGQSNFANRIILRNSGNEYDKTIIKDAALHGIAEGLNCDIQKSQPIVVFVNGEYWGIHNVRERYDKYYFEQKHGVDPNDIDFVSFSYLKPMEVSEGTADDYNETLNFLNSTASFSSQVMIDSLEKRIDFKNLQDYYITQTFINNPDWVTNNNNIALWRTRYLGQGLQEDKRWRWVLKDLDWGLYENGFGNESFCILEKVLDENTPTSVWLRRPLTNTQFKYDFINRYADLLNTYFLPSRTTTVVNGFKNEVTGEMPEHIDRWTVPGPISTWEGYISEMNTFLTARQPFMRQELKNQFALGNLYTLTANVSESAAGYVKVNTIDILPSTPGVSAAPYPWNGQYFIGVPLKIEAIPKDGFVFSYWEHNGVQLTDSILTINPFGDVNYLAVFEPVPVEDFVPLAYELDKCGYEFDFWDVNEPSGSFPDNMVFVYMDEEDPELTANIGGFTDGTFDNTSRTRINGLGTDGISFINTGSGNSGYPETKLGGAILAFSTLGQSIVNLSFTAGTVTPNSREYALRLQYRLNDTAPFEDLLDENNQAVEYLRSSTAGSEQLFDIELPLVLLEQPYVQLFWRYYYTGVRNNPGSGARDELRLDNINLQSSLVITQPVTLSESINNIGRIEGQSELSNGISLVLEAGKSIELTPGFFAENGTIFCATVTGCN